MKRTTIAIITLIMIGLSVFIISNFITHHTQKTLYISNELEKSVIQEHREKMREILKSSREGIMYDISQNSLDATSKKDIQKIILRHIAPIKSSEFGEILLIRLSPDGKILYDSSFETLQKNVDSRNIDDEIIHQNEAKKIISQFNDEKLDEYLNKGVIEIEDLEKIKSDNPEVYEKLNELTTYENLNQVKNILDLIQEGNSTSSGENNFWTVNEKKELLEWIVIPAGALGLDKNPDSEWGIEKDNHRWVMILRSNESNVLEHFKEFEEHIQQKVALNKILYVAFILLLCIGIIIIIYYVSLTEIKEGE